jgi:plasmid stability protein
VANLTLSIDEDLLRAARVRAAGEGTSVNEICRRAIESYARADSQQERLRRFDEFMARTQAQVRLPEAATWKSRDEFYEQVMAERGKPGR